MAFVTFVRLADEYVQVLPIEHSKKKSSSHLISLPKYPKRRKQLEYLRTK
jgi:hypothetical protein